jgi:hypothetical protein
MSRLDSDTLIPSPGQGTAIPSRHALLSIIGALAALVLSLTLASPGRADRQLIERGTELVTRAACLECHAAAAMIVVTFSGAKNSAGDMVPAFIRANASMASRFP